MAPVMNLSLPSNLTTKHGTGSRMDTFDGHPALFLSESYPKNQGAFLTGLVLPEPANPNRNTEAELSSLRIPIGSASTLCELSDSLLQDDCLGYPDIIFGSWHELNVDLMPDSIQEIHTTTQATQTLSSTAPIKRPSCMIKEENEEKRTRKAPQ